MDKKKILFIITHLELGGAQTQLLSVIKNLDHEKYSIHLITSDYGYLTSEFTTLSFLNTKLIPQLVRHIHPVYDLAAFFKIYSYIKRNKFDIIHTHSPKASMLGRWAAFFAGVKNIVYTVHGWPFHKFMNPISYMYFLYAEKLTARITKKIIVVSNSDLKIAIKKIAKNEKFALIHYGVDMGIYENIFLERKKIPPRHNLIINISSLKRQKGLIYFLKAVQSAVINNKKLQFYLVGDGPIRKSIVKMVKRRGLDDHIALKGWVRELKDLFSKASVLVLSSLWEGLPIVIVEAVMAGIPVVVTDTGGVSDIIENGVNGIILKPGRSKELFQAISAISNNHNEWDEKIRKYRSDQNLSYWSQRRMIREVSTLYDSL